MVEINYSSLELLQTCSRKAYYALEQDLRAQEESSAMAFGSAIHKALEVWYQLPAEQKLLTSRELELAEQYAVGSAVPLPDLSAFASVCAFVDSGRAQLSALPPTDKRSLQAGVRILNHYFKRYADDGFNVALDSSGAPLVERECSAIIYESDSVVIKYFGTIDVILENKQTGVILVADHKTTAALGKEFYDRCKPNPQYTGYVWLAREALGINTKLFMINGIQTAKTKTEFARQVTDRTEEDFAELKTSVVHRVQEWLSMCSLSDDNKGYPMTAPNPCSMYGGCAYRPICEVPDKLKQAVIAARYK